MSTMTIHTGLVGEPDIINVDWFDHNGNRRLEEIEIVCTQDKPRRLEIHINGQRVFAKTAHYFFDEE